MSHEESPNLQATRGHPIFQFLAEAAFSLVTQASHSEEPVQCNGGNAVETKVYKKDTEVAPAFTPKDPAGGQELVGVC